MPDESKQPFHIEEALARLRVVAETLPKAGLFALFDEGHTSPFETLVACIISIRTLDEIMLPVCRRLFARARTPAEVAALSVDELDALISASNFHAGKARQIHAIAETCVTQYANALPCDEALMLSLPGVGPKCANLALSIACGQPRIGVDIHVHRVANRWGYVQTTTPEKTLAALQTVLPREHWTELNRLVMPFGKFVCTGTRPHCSTCPLLSLCPQIGVTDPR